MVAAQATMIEALTERVAELERRVAADSSNSSRPPSTDMPWEKKPAKKRSSRIRSGRTPGKQPGTASFTRRLVDDPHDTVVIEPDRCRRCDTALAGAMQCGHTRRQVVDLSPPPPPVITEYRRVGKRCPGCGALTIPGWDHPAVPAEHASIVAAPGSPVRIGPHALARAALLTCAHYLPIGRSRELLRTLTAIEVSTGLLAGVRGRAARRLEKTFLGHMKTLLASAPVLHADETTARAAGALSYVHVACTEYLTLMHVGGRTMADIDAGGVLPAFTGVLVSDGYPATST